MGVTIFYQVIPEQSALFARLQSDPASYLLFAEFFPRGSGPFSLEGIEAEERDEVVDFLAASPAGARVFGSPAGVEKALDRLETDLRQTKQLYPGIEYRAAMLEKNDQDLYVHLAPFFQTRGGESSLGLLLAILHGNEQPLASAGMVEGDTRLWLVTAARVQEAARLLQDLTPETVFEAADDDTRDWLEEDYTHWRSVYLQAADRNEAMIIG